MNEKELLALAYDNFFTTIYTSRLLKEFIPNNPDIQKEYIIFIEDIIYIIKNQNIDYSKYLENIVDKECNIPTNYKLDVDHIIKVKAKYRFIYNLVLGYQCLVLLYIKNKIKPNIKKELLELKKITTFSVKQYLIKENLYKENQELVVIQKLEEYILDHIIRFISM